MAGPQVLSRLKAVWSHKYPLKITYGKPGVVFEGLHELYSTSYIVSSTSDIRIWIDQLFRRSEMIRYLIISRLETLPGIILYFTFQKTPMSVPFVLMYRRNRFRACQMKSMFSHNNKTCTQLNVTSPQLICLRQLSKYLKTISDAQNFLVFINFEMSFLWSSLRFPRWTFLGFNCSL